MQCYIFIYGIKKSTIQGKNAHEENDRARRKLNIFGAAEILLQA